MKDPCRPLCIGNRFPALLPSPNARLEAPHPDCILALPGPGDIVGSLHAHERVHLDAKSSFQTERHIPGQVGLAIEQAGQSGPGNLKDPSRRRHRQTSRLDNLRPNEIPRMGRVQHTTISWGGPPGPQPTPWSACSAVFWGRRFRLPTGFLPVSDGRAPVSACAHVAAFPSRARQQAFFALCPHPLNGNPQDSRRTSRSGRRRYGMSTAGYV